MDYKELRLLKEYISKPDDCIFCWDLAHYYKENSEWNPAIYFFIRCAETARDDLLSYECLMHASLCFTEQQNKPSTVLKCLEEAIKLFPHRPEAYFLKANHFLKTKKYELCMDFVDFSLSFVGMLEQGNGRPENGQTSLISNPVGYYGLTSWYFVKGCAEFYSGRYKESSETFSRIKETAIKDLHWKDHRIYLDLVGQLVDMDK